MQRHSSLLICCLGALLLCCLQIAYYAPTLAIDFQSLYQSLLAFVTDNNPYQASFSSSLGTTLYGANLNPPFFLLLFYPLSFFSFANAYILWSFLSLLSALLGLYLSSQILNLKPYPLVVWSLLLLSYPALINLMLGQLGYFLFALIMSGYYFQKQSRQALASFIWGVAIAIKLFPALILFYLLYQRRYKLLLLTLTWALLLSALPLLVASKTMFYDYWQVVRQITWYSHNWNLSIFGLFFKLFLRLNSSEAFFQLLKYVAAIVWLFGLFLYLALLYLKKLSEQAQFSLTLCFMILLSPLGWVYYLPLLFFPVLVAISDWHKSIYRVAVIFLTIPIAVYFIPGEHFNLLTMLCLQSLPMLGIALLTYNQLQLAKSAQSSIGLPLLNFKKNTDIFFGSGLLLVYGFNMTTFLYMLIK